MAKKATQANNVETVVEVQEVPVDDKGRKSVVNLTMEEVAERGWQNKSQIIRGLDSEGFSRSAIAKFLDIRYQHVRNVLVQPLKRPAASAETSIPQADTNVE